MSNKVSALGKAFAGVLAVLVLVVWLKRDEDVRAAETRLVYDSAPADAASAAFARGERFFYETWHPPRGGDDKVGKWSAPGSHEAMGVLLLRFPERRRLEGSWHMSVSADDSIRFARDAARWAHAHNTRMAALIGRLE